MSGDAELLNFIYQNSQMGVDTIRQLIGVVEDKDLKEHLKTQFQGYEEFHQAAKELLNEHGYDEKGLGIMEKARTYFMINLQTMTDPSVSHIASMLITGSSMGIVEAIQKYRQYEDADPKIRDLMDKLRKFEEYNMEKLKRFLMKIIFSQTTRICRSCEWQLLSDAKESRNDPVPAQNSAAPDFELF